MKTFLSEIIPKIKRYSKKLDDLTVITNKHWILIDEENTEKTVFIFRGLNNQLLISKNGKIEKGNWEYLGNNSIVIDRADGSYLFKHGFVDDSVLALKVDGKEEYALLVNENKFDDFHFISIDNILNFLRKEYIDEINKKTLEVKPVEPEEIEPEFITVKQHDTNYIITYSRAEWERLKKDGFGKFHDIISDETN